MTTIPAQPIGAVAVSLGRSMLRLSEIVDAETYEALRRQIVAECEKTRTGDFTEEGIRQAAREFEKTVWAFEDEGYDDSIERAERAVGA